MKCKFCFSFIFCVIFLGQLRSQQPGFAVVELFTSEGCSTCPPADQLLSTIIHETEKDQRKIFALSFHVDYWNRAGWKDPFSKNQFTFRQENYSRVLPDKELYTPQIIVNGKTEGTGSDHAAAKKAIDEALNAPAFLDATVHMDSTHADTLFVTYTSSKTDKNFVFRFALSENDLSSQVTSGENKGKMLHHDSVVRIFFSLDIVEEKGQVKIPLKDFVPNAKCSLTGFVQHKQSMKILGADRFEFK